MARLNTMTRWWLRGLLRLVVTILLCLLLAALGYLLIVGVFLSIHFHALN